MITDDELAPRRPRCPASHARRGPHLVRPRCGLAGRRARRAASCLGEAVRDGGERRIRTPRGRVGESKGRSDRWTRRDELPTVRRRVRHDARHGWHGTGVALPGRRSRRGRPSTSGSSVAEGRGQRGRELGHGHRVATVPRRRRPGPCTSSRPSSWWSPVRQCSYGAATTPRRGDQIRSICDGALPLDEEVREVRHPPSGRARPRRARRGCTTGRPVSTLTSASSSVVITSLRRLDLVGRHDSRGLAADEVEPDRPDDGVVGDLEPASVGRGMPGAGVPSHRRDGRSVRRTHRVARSIAARRAGTGGWRAAIDRSRPPRHGRRRSIRSSTASRRWSPSWCACMPWLTGGRSRAASGPAACSRCAHDRVEASRRPRPPDRRGAARAQGSKRGCSGSWTCQSWCPTQCVSPDDIEEEVPAPPARGGGATPTASPRARRARRASGGASRRWCARHRARDGCSRTGANCSSPRGCAMRAERMVAAGCRHRPRPGARAGRPRSRGAGREQPHSLSTHAVEGARARRSGGRRGRPRGDPSAERVSQNGVPSRLARAGEPEVVASPRRRGPSCSSGAARPRAPVAKVFQMEPTKVPYGATVSTVAASGEQAREVGAAACPA